MGRASPARQRAQPSLSQAAAVDSSESPFRRDLLDGKVALITGGATGLGMEIDHAVGEHGVRVANFSSQEDYLSVVYYELACCGIWTDYVICIVHEARN